MSTGLVMSIIAGASVGLGVALLLTQILPAKADLPGALERLSPTRHTATMARADARAATRTDRVGRWAMANLPTGLWVRTPHRELALLDRPLSQFYGEKLALAAVGLVLPVALATFYTTLGLHPPVALPAVVSLGLAAVLFFAPNRTAVQDAKKARTEFRRALGAYIELVALERTNGAGVRQAMEAAAGVGDTWVFTRLDEELSRSRLSGVAPWTALRTLGDDLALPELHDFADIMRLSGEQGAAVYTNLRARADSMRTALLGEELTEANATGERMSIPGAVLGVVFMALLIAPALLRMFTHT
ncbi:type II secretion system F family protein [Xylanimonas protaetiae]|uniref:Type II secretion system protein GspF domain-containing protein n=1 Tax=Xylanimonas protaetiae TaxID=2509457 RepID=A0A4P6F231_9MICO|nr:type II secretion system F family protein [Xylanimonas protaetiae]QAY68763.1 hypothetical protein ET471_00795 [Xylanimonas protaetiae]